MSVFSQMHFIERMPASQQRQQQLQQIERVLRHAYDTVPYYRDRLAGINRIPQGRLEEEFFTTIPILTRSEVQAHKAELFSSRVPPEHGGMGLLSSSGSTGKPVEVLATDLRLTYSMACSLRAQYWHRGHEIQKCLDIRAVHASDTTHKDQRWSILPWSGRNRRMDVHRPLVELFEHLIAEDPAFVMTVPYTLVLLAERTLQTGIRPKSLVEARTFGGRVSPGIREVIREAWDVPVVENYSANEVGTMAHQCPDTENLHVQIESVRVDVLNDDDSPCQPGTTGRVVVTTLHNFAMPLIRYEIGDYAEVGEACSCGRSLPVLTKILGRHRNICVLRNGDRFFPYLDAPMRAFQPIRQFQVHQRTLDDIDVKVVVSRPFTDKEKDELQAVLQKVLRYPFNVNIFEVADIPRAASGKFEDFKSDIPGSDLDN